MANNLKYDFSTDYWFCSFIVYLAYFKRFLLVSHLNFLPLFWSLLVDDPRASAGSCKLSKPLAQSARLSRGLFRVSAVRHLRNHANDLCLIFFFR